MSNHKLTKRFRMQIYGCFFNYAKYLSVFINETVTLAILTKVTVCLFNFY